ncbi:hypothetical protein DFH29DRAFT_395798 [Suillus ampliporus]|nr:hypothetical protein DFH29DRAFT_395798 [Suillus ampliporus]
MLSYTPQTDLWLERSRLDGMVLGSVSYGVFCLLTVQAWIALMKRPRYGGKIADHCRALLSYILITFVLRTISSAVSAKYTEMIGIDLRDVPGGPTTLIGQEMNCRINPGNCSIIHHPSRCTGAGSYTRMVESSCCSTYDYDICSDCIGEIKR